MLKTWTRLTLCLYLIFLGIKSLKKSRHEYFELFQPIHYVSNLIGQSFDLFKTVIEKIEISERRPFFVAYDVFLVIQIVLAVLGLYLGRIFTLVSYCISLAYTENFWTLFTRTGLTQLENYEQYFFIVFMLLSCVNPGDKRVPAPKTLLDIVQGKIN